MNLVRGWFLRAALLAAFIGVLTPLAHAADTARAGIEAANAEFSAAAAKGDGAALAALYAADGQVLPPGGEPVKGRAAIQKFWQGAIDSGVGAISLKTIDVFAQGSTATEVGQYELRGKDGAVLDHGKYIVIWRHTGGQWKLLRDMYSTNVTPAKK